MQSRTRILGRFAHAVVRACLSGAVMHVVIVAACSAGGGLQSEPWNDGSAGSGALSDAGVSSSAGRGPSGPKGPATGSEKPSATADSGSPSFVPVPSAQAAESGSRLKAKWLVAEDGSRQFNYQWRVAPHDT